MEPSQSLTGSHNEAHSSGVSWAAILAGASVTAAMSLALLALGTGVGFSAVSPWAAPGAAASRLGWTAIGWLVLMQLIAASAGGYLAGRLRTRWVHVHGHEVYFRDTAHGFLVWAVALVITAAFLTSAAASLLGRSASAGTTAAAGNAGASHEAVGPTGYLIDNLLRPATYTGDRDTSAARSEIGVIFANDIPQGSLNPADRTYLAQVVAAKAGISQSDAEQRVDAIYTQAQQAADAARKAVAHSLYWTFLALLVGAFCSSIAATIGGRERDNVVII